MGKNKQKITLLFIFIILIIIPVAIGCFNSLSTQKELHEEDKQNPVSNNYQGLRIETKNLDLEELADSYPRIVCFGDSVTFGWNVDYKDSYPNLLEELLEEDYAKVKVINSGIGGNTILDAYDRVENDVIGYNPHLVVINFGLNDGRIQEKNEYENGAEEPAYNGDKEDSLVPNIDLETFNKYYSLIVDKIESADIKIILMGMNFVLALSSAENNIDAEEQIEIYKNYNDEVRKISVNNHIDFIDLWDIFKANDKECDYLQGDGIHPNEEGFKLIANIVYEVIRSYNFQ
jgi:lysophospholipase L1-like esterase